MPTTQILTLDGVSMELIRKRIKNVYVRVLPPLGLVRISAPFRMSEAEIREFARSKFAWIRSHQERMRANAPQEPHSFADGDAVVLWGRPRRLRFFPVGGRRRIFLRGEFIDLHAPISDKPETRRKLVEKLYRRELEREIQRLLAQWCPVIGVPIPEFFIRRMRTRWGSCSPSTSRMRFALHLAEKPARLLEYVVVHELVHLLERGHNKRFAACMDRFLPNWRGARSEMRSG
jgi:predicted metal-dependent hydrolase